MSLHQLRIRIEHLEAKSPEKNEERALRAHWEELRLRQWMQTNRPNEVEKPLTEEEKAKLKELTYRFDRFAKKRDEMVKMYEEAAAEQEDRDRRRRPRPNDFLD
jgi:hypothetical protein